jgi:hypothetical protein
MRSLILSLALAALAGAQTTVVNAPATFSGGGVTIGNTVVNPTGGITTPNIPFSLNRSGGLKTLPPSLKSWALYQSNVVPKGGGGSWKSSAAGYGMDVVWDTATGQYAMVYAGYNGTKVTIGLAYSNDLVTWTDYGSNPILDVNGVGGQSDSGGMTFPQLWFEGGTWYMYYIGFPNSGFEQGTPTHNFATATALTGPWTRSTSNPTLSPSQVSWASGVIYRPNIVKNGSTYYMFFNGGVAAGTEDIGYARGPHRAQPLC